MLHNENIFKCRVGSDEGKNKNVVAYINMHTCLSIQTHIHMFIYFSFPICFKNNSLEVLCPSHFCLRAWLQMRQIFLVQCVSQQSECGSSGCFIFTWPLRFTMGSLDSNLLLQSPTSFLKDAWENLLPYLCTICPYIREST